MLNTLGEAIDLLGNLLGEEIKQLHGLSLHNKVEALRLRCKDVKSSQDLNQIKSALSQYPLAELKKLIHCFAVFFLISNQAEQCEIIKIKRRRRSNESLESPRAESIAEAIRNLSKTDINKQKLIELLSEISLTPTITAHPTEARRRSVLQKQLAIAKILFKLNSNESGELDRKELIKDLKAIILELLVTDDVRAKRLSVQDEVENGIFFLAGSVLEIVPEIMQDLKQACSQYFDLEIEPNSIVKYRSWIGGDRDGNPNVNAEITKEALTTHRTAIISYYKQSFKKLRNELSVSTRKVAQPKYLFDSVRADRVKLGLDPEGLIDSHQIHEPLREKCECIYLKLEKLLNQEIQYLEKDFIEDLTLLEKTLVESGLNSIAKRGLLNKIINQAKVFGFSLADLDLRQHSKIHQASLNEIFKKSGLSSDYSNLNEQEKILVLEKFLNTKTIVSEENLSPETSETLKVFRLIQELEQRKFSGLGAYVISMTHSVSDMLEPLALWKAVSEEKPFPLDLVPLFETIEDLEGSKVLLENIVSNSIYSQHLKSRNNFQEIMLGYSDSNKDGGYTAANILLYEAQRQIAEVCNSKNIKFQIFHGRGGSVGRGGGRAGRAILSSPPESHSGKVRFTEQGEVISFRYSMPELGHRHLEQIVSAVILSVGSSQSSLDTSELNELKEIGELARIKYRSLIDAPGFWEWYVGITPIKFISSLPIASRPVMRAGTNLEFENLRAIPWVFSWTQTRYNVPSWFGLGSAFESKFSTCSQALERMQKLYKEKVVFQSLIDNAQQEMARARLIIAEQYNSDSDRKFHKVIEDEFKITEKIILAITTQQELLDNNPVIKKSINTRNPYTDALNLIQADLLNRVSKSKDPKELEELGEAIHMSISALAAAMQTTG